jgi:hypothetical protein
VTCSLGELLAGDSTSVEIGIMTTLEGSLTNNASVSADTTDTNQGNNSDSETTTVMPLEQGSSRKIFLPQILKSSG